MNRLSRRHLASRLGGTAAAIAMVSALAACGGSIPVPSGDTIATDLGLITSAFNQITGFLSNLPANLQPSAATIAQIEAELKILNDNAASITGSLAPSADTIQKIASAIKLISALAGPFFPEAPIIGSIVSAALSLLPGILAAVGITSATRAALLTPAEVARNTLRASLIKS